MRYAMCPRCGRKLCKGESGTNIEIECPKCGELVSVIIKDDDVHISKRESLNSKKLIVKYM